MPAPVPWFISPAHVAALVPAVPGAGEEAQRAAASFIAQTQRVAGVIMFSGGWDPGPGGAIAQWYSRASETPPERWHGSFHVLEGQAATMELIYQRLGLPASQIHGKRSINRVLVPRAGC